MELIDKSIEYDGYGRMKFHPEYHYNHGKPYTVQELAYICQHYYRGNVRTLSMAVGRTEGSLRSLVDKLKRTGDFEFYKGMEVSQWVKRKS